MNNTANKNGVFKTIQIIYGAFILGVTVFAVVAFSLIENQIFNIDTNDIFTIIVPIVAVSSLFIK